MNPIRSQTCRNVSCAGAVLMLLAAMTAAAREGTPPISLQRRVQSLGTVPQLVLPPVDKTAELAADEKRNTPTPVRFAVEQKLNVTPATHGAWEQLPDGRLVRGKPT